MGDLSGLGRRGGREGRAWRGTVWVGEGVGYIFTRPSIGNASAYGQTITYTGRGKGGDGTRSKMRWISSSVDTTLTTDRTWVSSWSCIIWIS